MRRILGNENDDFGGIDWNRMLQNGTFTAMSQTSEKRPAARGPSRTRRASPLRRALSMLLILTLFAAWGCGVYLAIGWGRAKRQREAVEAIRGAGGQAWYAYQIDSQGYPQPRARPPAGRLNQWLGDDFFQDVVEVHLGRRKFDDSHAAWLRGLPGLRKLTLTHSRVTDAGLAHVANLDQMRELYLGATPITDAGLAHLNELRRLKVLWLHDTAVSDAGLPQLAKLKRLEVVILFDSKATWQGVAALRRRLPRAEIAIGD